MQWNFKGIQDHIKKLITIEGTWQTDQTTHFKNLIQIAINTVAITFPIDELRGSSWLIIPADYSTGTVTATVGSKTVTGLLTVWTPEMIGRKIKIGTGVDSYTIADVVSNTEITLDDVFNGTAGSALAYTIFDNTAPLPYDFAWARGIYVQPDNRLGLTEVGWDWIEDVDSRFIHTGTPTHYALIGMTTSREPITATIASTTGTSTTSLVSTNLTSTVDDFYKGWTLVNTTRGLSSKVTGYTASSTTLTLETPITAQVSGDAVYLENRQSRVMFYRRPTAKSRYKLIYYKNHPDLVNDYDIPLIPVAFLNYITASVLEIYFEKDVLSQKWSGIREREERILRTKYGKVVGNSQKQGRRVQQGTERMIHLRIGD